MGPPQHPLESRRIPPLSAIDVAVGAATAAIELAATVGRRAAPFVEPATRLLMSPRLPVAGQVQALARRGRAQRGAGLMDLSRLLDAVVPVVMVEVLRRTDLTELVKRYVDLDDVVACVDLNAAAARIDVDAVASRIDVDAVVRRANLNAAAARIDVDAVVRRADLNQAAARINVDAVAQRLDFDAILDRLDLTGIVLERVNLDVLVSEVLDRIDLVGLAEQVIDAIDLPEIIRESTGSMASDTVRGVRMQSIAGDEAISRAVDRLLLRRGRRPEEP